MVDGRIGGVIMDGTEQLLAFNGAPEVTAQYREGGWNLGGVNEKGKQSIRQSRRNSFGLQLPEVDMDQLNSLPMMPLIFEIRAHSWICHSIAANKAIKGAKVSLVARNLCFYTEALYWIFLVSQSAKCLLTLICHLGNGNWQERILRNLSFGPEYRYQFKSNLLITEN
ncbi:MAG: hypothetical protein IPI77_23555 [Saprospiraceae bacterium]|nr:hypothetical protein [Saprospiraceae bacterium]